MGRLIDIENIDYVRLEDSLHCLEHHKGDEVECVICAPTVEAIPKTDYENRLKADLVAMLTEIQEEIEEEVENPYEADTDNLLMLAEHNAFDDAETWIKDIIQEEINALKEGT